MEIENKSLHVVEENYWRHQWLHPMTLFALLGILGTAYAAFMLHRERVERLEARIVKIEEEYQRKEVQKEQLEAILQRLEAIEASLKAR